MGKKKNQRVAAGPGPGYYNPDQADKVTKDRSRGATFNSPGRKDLAAKSSRDLDQGPGTYDARDPSKGAGKSFTIGAKRPTKFEKSNVGPGTYSQSTKATKERTKSATISKPTATPKKRPSRTSIGPGAYEPPTKFGSNAKGFQMSGKRPSFRRDNTPGPGFYQTSNNSTLKHNQQSHKMTSPTPAKKIKNKN